MTTMFISPILSIQCTPHDLEIVRQVSNASVWQVGSIKHALAQVVAQCELDPCLIHLKLDGDVPTADGEAAVAWL